jgi:hypothetical protein
MFSSNLFRTRVLVALATIALATAACGSGDDSIGSHARSHHERYALREQRLGP